MIDTNRAADRRKPLEEADRAAFGPEAAATVGRFLAACPSHRPTPLHALPGLADRLGLGALHVKDEGQRLGLGSFKALGGAYAVIRLVLEAAETGLGRALAPAQLRDPEIRAVAGRLTMGCATDGNHGRSVAAGARLAGCRAAIFVHAGVDPERIEAIARFGAAIIRVPGSYDDAVAEAGRRCAAEGWTVVSDTSWPGYERIASLVMQGYTVLAAEALATLPAPPTHVFLQAGVGGFAAAIAAHLHLRLGAHCPKLIVVEPERAACLFESHRAGAATRIREGEPTVMAMLECYEPSMVAWRILSRLTDAFVTIPDGRAVDAMRLLAHATARDPSIVAGESGGAGLAGLLAVLDDPGARALVGLDEAARVLLVNTEGATAPATYARLVGTPPC